MLLHSVLFLFPRAYTTRMAERQKARRSAKSTSVSRKRAAVPAGGWRTQGCKWVYHVIEWGEREGNSPVALLPLTSSGQPNQLIPVYSLLYRVYTLHARLYFTNMYIYRATPDSSLSLFSFQCSYNVSIYIYPYKSHIYTYKGDIMTRLAWRKSSV